MAKAHTLVDNFNDNAVDNVKWLVNGSDGLFETNRRVEIRPLTDQPGLYAYTSRAAYDLTDSEFRVQLIRPLTGPATTGLDAMISGNDLLAIWVGQGELTCGQVVNGAYRRLEHIPYDAAEHRWLRLRERAGITFWEASPDGEDWTTVHQAPNPIPLTAVMGRFGAQVFVRTPAAGFAVFDNFNVEETGDARRVDERRLSARAVRKKAASLAARRDHEAHANNNDEINYPETPLAGNYSKSLRHDDIGDPDAASYASLLRALESRDPADFDEIVLADGATKKLTNPQAGLAFDVEGPDAQEVTIPPAPRFDSIVTAHEMGELYWMAAARDVPFAEYGTRPRIAAAVASLNSEFPQFGGTVPVTAQNVFRGIYPGEQVGPYVSQFLLKGNVDPRKPAGYGRDATDGFISYGARVIDQRLVPARAGRDYLGTFQVWLDVQNGEDRRGQDEFESARVFIHTLRDGATFVHFDQVVDAFYNAAWILMSEPTGNQSTFLQGTTGRPQIDAEFPYDQGNPYMPPAGLPRSRTEAGFATFGPTHLLQVVPEVLGRALRAVWWQKWGVHRRLRPEEFGGRVDNWIAGRRDYPIHHSVRDSLVTGGLSAYFGPGKAFPNSYLLPQAYPEGAPTHPAYGAGHATGSGAMITILKAFFDDTAVIENPVQASESGLTLIPWTPAQGEPPMTVGGELNKLAGNIATFRNAAGVHWRSDYTGSLPFGEAIAIRLLQEMSLGFNEDDAFFELTRLDGVRIRIHDGKVAPVL
ncbi:vanadium-dependent haloperoxidase [Longimicrobium terrae]|uniref:Phosphoesterase n=1 Tax=Longimicrobium terrae TaxID=1639882 RepID=A0A841GQW9_9BACT|nr:vanadium-dependent haloperoxidase [Longimicrobium terrae]MBB4635548.1 hypothetical protein [Longimicrobium terrae]MBB6069942.1 hypothetical protein [Longimicrobium terrae]NNC32855.1 vanadium-dependent haloperoxidase [Longimicrobium terrae]